MRKWIWKGQFRQLKAPSAWPRYKLCGLAVVVAFATARFHLFRIANSQLNPTSRFHFGGLGRIAFELILAEDICMPSCPRTGVNKLVTQIFAQIGRHLNWP